MFDNFLLSIKSKLNIHTEYNKCNIEDSKRNNCNKSKNKYFAHQFINNILNRNRNYISIGQHCDAHMFPRVYGQGFKNDTCWDPVELAPREKKVDDLDNVIDKFVRVIQNDNDFERRTDREEIRRRLAMGAEEDYFEKTISDKPGRKPSLHSRLQNGMNLQICFMNETASDTESSSSNSESCPKLSKSPTFTNHSSNSYYSRYNSGSHHPYNSRPLSVNIKKSSSMEKARPTSLAIGPKTIPDESKEVDFFTKQARLQIEARMALAQAKDMAHMQMEMDRQKHKQSPITEIIRNSLQKVGVAFPPEKRRVSRQMLTDMNIAQLQVIVNELHTQIERLNENLVQYLMNRDDLHMSQDSMLVDIEDLTRYLGAKEQRLDPKSTKPLSITAVPTTITAQTVVITTTAAGTATVNKTHNKNLHFDRPHSQNKFLRIANLVKK